jgi:hypothetical protein
VQDERLAVEDQGTFPRRLGGWELGGGGGAVPNLLADDALLQRIANAVCGATTLDEAEPWVRLTEPNSIEVHADVGPEQWLADPSGRARYLSVGAALFNLRLAIRRSGLEPVVRLLPESDRSPTLVATLLLSPGSPATQEEGELFAAVDHQVRGWRLWVPRLSKPDRQRLELAARAEHATLRLLSGPEAVALRARIATEERELAGSVRVSQTRLPWPHPVLGVLTTGGDGPQAWLEAGQALQRMLITAADCGLAAVPLYQPIEVHDMLAEAEWWPGEGTPQVLVEFGPGAGRRGTSPVSIAAVPPAL